MSYLYPDLFLRLIAAHIISDFFLQPTGWVNDKKNKKLSSPFLYLHILIVGIFSYAAFNFKFSYSLLIIIFTHLIIDILKVFIDERKSDTNEDENFLIFLTDQVSHFIVILVVWLIYTGQTDTFQKNIVFDFSNVRLLLILTSFLLVTFPSSIFVNKLTNAWSKDIGVNAGLKNAGMWIGIVERILVLTFTLIGSFEAIGFLLAAKSVFRFGDLKDKTDHKRTEYILIGTLLSFMIAIFIGLSIQSLS